MHELRVRLYEHLQSLSLAFFATARTGEVQSRLSSDIAGLQSLFTNTATDVARNVTVVLTTVVAMTLLDWRLALASLAVMPVLLWLNTRVAALRERITFRQQERIADMSATVTESLSAGGFILARTMGRARHLVRLFRQTSSDVARLELQSHTAGQWEVALIMFALDILPALTFLVGGLMLANGLGVSIGTLVALIALQEQLLFPLLELFEARIELRKARALLTRVFDYLDTEPTLVEPAVPVRVDVKAMRGEIVFEDVSFRYPASDRRTLDHVTLRIAAGTHTAVVGSTGSGKSTLGYLIARLYDPDSGGCAGRHRSQGFQLRDALAYPGGGDAGPVPAQRQHRGELAVRKPGRVVVGDRTGARVGATHRPRGEPSKGLQTEVGERGYQFSPGASGKGCRSPGPSCAIRASSSSTRRRAPSIRRREGPVRSPRRSARPHGGVDRPSPLDGAPCRPDRRAGRRTHPRNRNPRSADRREWALSPTGDDRLTAMSTGSTPAP